MQNIDKEKASLIVTDHILKFHNIDRRKEYRKKWFENYNKETKISRERMNVIGIK